MQQDTLMETLENPNNLLPKIRQPPSPLDLNLKQVRVGLVYRTLNGLWLLCPKFLAIYLIGP